MTDDTAIKLFTVHELKVEDVDRDPDQPRTEMTGIEELAASIATFGQRHPILVRKTGNRYRIIGGERRWTAINTLGLATVYAYVADSDDAEVTLLELVDNQHVALSDAEKSRGAQRAFTFELPIERVAVAVGRDTDSLTKARRGFDRVGDPAASETLSLDRLIAIDEFADDEGAVIRLLTAPEALWRNTHGDLVRERKHAADAETAKRVIAESGCTLLTDGFLNPDGYRYLTATLVTATMTAPEGATAARINTYGTVSITWYAPAGEDTVSAAEGAERAARDKMHAALTEAHEDRIAFLAANFELDTGLKKLAEAAWENGTTASVADLSGPLAKVRGFTARVTASLLSDQDDGLSAVLRNCDGALWTLRTYAEEAVAYLDKLLKAGYQPAEDEAARIVIVREKVKTIVANRKKRDKAAAVAAADGAPLHSCDTCWEQSEGGCEGAENDDGSCEDWTDLEPEVES